MKSLLFIVPSRSNSGTNSSLSAIYNILKDNYNIEILTITASGNGFYAFLDNSFSNIILKVYYENYKLLTKKERLLSLILKPLKHLTHILHINIDNTICRCAAFNIEKHKHYDCIIGFQEGLAMRVAANFTNPNKYTWIHCDYDRAVSLKTNEIKYYQKFKKIICVSNFTKEKFLSRYPSLEKNTSCIYNLLDIDKIDKLSNEKIKDSRFINNFFTIITAGRMDPVKQFSVIPKIAKKIADGGCKFRWYILGGPENDEFRKIQVEIKRYNTEEFVILLGNKRNPYPYFKASHLYVSTSLSEACPMVFNEARICGIPIVSSDFGSAHEFIKNGIDGLLGSTANLAELIIPIIKNKNYYNQFKINNSLIHTLNTEIKDKLVLLFA